MQIPASLPASRPSPANARPQSAESNDRFELGSALPEWRPIKILPATSGAIDPQAQYVSESQFHAAMVSMPKVELHTHVEGAVRPETILDIAEQHQLPLPADTASALKEKIGMRPGEDLLAFLKKFDHFRFVFDQPSTLERLAYECIEDNARENIGYTELRINPRKNLQKVSIDEVLDSVLKGMKQASSDLGVESRLIVSINRSYPVESAMDIARAAVARKDQGVVGLDLAGDEVHHPASKFKEVFAYARENGLHVTIHAGEAVGPESIRQAIEDCGAQRIGHGVRLQEDPKLEAEVRQKGVVLEMCPTSNQLLNVTPDLKQYPLKRYHHQGIAVTINTDDRHIFDVTLASEFTTLARETGMSLQELQQVALNGVEAAFLPAAEKAELRSEFQREMLEFNANLPRQLYTTRA